MKINEYIEHTKLNPDLRETDVDRLIEEAITYSFAGVCLPPFWVKRAGRELEDTDVKLITVVGFPLGYQMTEAKLKECEMAIENGADEIDIVMNISAFKSGLPWVKIELAKCSALLHQSNVVMKVIIETSLLTNEEIVTVAKMCVDSGADFVKTSTGFSSAGAKTEHIRLIKSVIPSQVQIKASGGIKTYDQAMSMIEAGAARIGTSSGINIIKSLAG
ncbi:deoxyribose-phosphate aldolase [Reichenbachiella sp. MALMAid0571]|uniref:deoxyribose-phosphate aldolase n=1 Tax=Reichenbachiella sp. MALMAid0571 TaxID=3143939 RepID=UPI0032DE3DFF